MEQISVTITLPESIAFSNRDRGPLAKLALADLPADMIARGAIFGITTSIMNAYNSGGDSHNAKFAALEKRLTALRRGDWEQAQRGESYFTTWRDEVFIPRCIEDGMTIAAAKELIKEKVASAFGAKETPTFNRYLDACAVDEVKAGNFETTGDARDAIEAFYTFNLETRRAARAKSAKKITAPSIDLSAFKKVK
jgi:hypothetical protein